MFYSHTFHCNSSHALSIHCSQFPVKFHRNTCVYLLDTLEQCSANGLFSTSYKTLYLWHKYNENIWKVQQRCKKVMSFLFSGTTITIKIKFTCTVGTSFTDWRLVIYETSFIINTLLPYSCERRCTQLTLNSYAVLFVHMHLYWTATVRRSLQLHTSLIYLFLGMSYCTTQHSRQTQWQSKISKCLVTTIYATGPHRQSNGFLTFDFQPCSIAVDQ